MIYLDLNKNGIHDSVEPAVTTDSSGSYSFANVTPGVYSVAMEGQSGSRQTLPVGDSYVVTVHPDETVSGLDFGAMAIASGPRLPAITSTVPAVAAVSQPYRYAISVHNPDGVALQFDLAERGGDDRGCRHRGYRMDARRIPIGPARRNRAAA